LEAGSDENLAIECAAKALLFLQQSQQLDDFEKYLQEFDGDLTDAQREHLKSMGIDV